MEKPENDRRAAAKGQSRGIFPVRIGDRDDRGYRPACNPSAAKPVDAVTM